MQTTLRRFFGRRFVAFFLLLLGVWALAMPALAGPTDPPLAPKKDEVTQVVVSGGTRSLFKVAVAPVLGDSGVSATMVDTMSKDLALSSFFQVLDPKSFTANLEREGMGIDPSSWRNIGAEGVIKGSSQLRGGSVHLELRLYVVSRGGEAVLKKEFDVASAAARTSAHQFVNEVIKWFTGTAGSFGTRLVYSASVGQGQKGIFSIDADGHGAGRLQTVSNVSLSPSIGPGGVYYSAGLADGSYQLFRVGNPAAVLKHAGLVFGAAFSGSKMAAVISQNGQSDIYVGAPDGSGLTKVTKGGLNTHPAFGPGGQLAYVSNAEGNPQIFVDGKKVSTRGSYNMSPAFCADADGFKILYMGRDGSAWDIFSIEGATTKRLTQDQGTNTYPACSPDGRMVAFFSSRGGLFLMNGEGKNQTKIAGVSGESLRWEGN